MSTIAATSSVGLVKQYHRVFRVADAPCFSKRGPWMPGSHCPQPFFSGIASVSTAATVAAVLQKKCPRKPLDEACAFLFSKSGISPPGARAIRGPAMIAWLAAVPHGAARVREPAANGQRARHRLVLPNKRWLDARLPAHGLAKPSAARITGLMRLSSGVAWDGPLCTWGIEADILRKF